MPDGGAHVSLTPQTPSLRRWGFLVLRALLIRRLAWEGVRSATPCGDEKVN